MTRFEEQNLPRELLILSLLVVEAIFVTAFTIYGDPFFSIYHLLLTLLLTGVIVFLGGFGMKWQLSWNSWISRQHFEWYHFFTTPHYLAWLYDKNEKAWSKLTTLFSYPISAELIFLWLGSFNMLPQRAEDIGIVYLVIGSLLFSVIWPFVVWLSWNLFKELT